MAADALAPCDDLSSQGAGASAVLVLTSSTKKDFNKSVYLPMIIHSLGGSDTERILSECGGYYYIMLSLFQKI